MLSKLPKILAFIFFLLLTVLFFVSTTIARAATSGHIVISEIQTGPGNNEFLELYNPTANDVNLSNWHITKKSIGTTSETNFIAGGLTGTIQGYGFYLLANNKGGASSSADITYSTGFTNDSVVSLYSDNKITLVDKVEIGTASGNAPNPPDSKSIERKAKSNSTSETMTNGGIDEFNGNGEDTENNANDFVLRNIPQPQNSSSTLEPIPTQTPTGITTATPTDTPTITPTVTPTATPTITETPTESPSPTISITPTDTPATTPTDSPTQTPTPTNSLSPTPTLSATPTPTGTFPFITIPKFRTVCTTNIINFRILFVQFHFPMITCTLTTL